MTRVRLAIASAPLLLILAACGTAADSSSGSASSSASSSSALSSSASPSATDELAEALANLSPECEQAITSFETYYLDLAGIAMSLASSGDIDEETKKGLAAAADELDRNATGLDGVLPDAPGAYADLVTIIRGQATTLRTWSESHNSTDGLAEAMDTFTEGSVGQLAFVGVIDDLQVRCAPYEWSN